VTLLVKHRERVQIVTDEDARNFFLIHVGLNAHHVVLHDVADWNFGSTQEQSSQGDEPCDRRGFVLQKDDVQHFVPLGSFEAQCRNGATLDPYNPFIDP
jgi:hypothetical protein